MTAAEREAIARIVERTCAEQNVPVVVPPATCAEVAAILRAGMFRGETAPAVEGVASDAA